MSDSHSTGGFPSIWLDSSEPLPHTCITCGMFTDHFEKSKYAHRVQTTVATGESGSAVALGCLAHLLGPLGLLLAAAMNGGNKNEGGTTEKTTTKKISIKVPCCRLCAGQQVPEPLDGRPNASGRGGRFLFEAHPRFAERLVAERRATIDQ